MIQRLSDPSPTVLHRIRGWAERTPDAPALLILNARALTYAGLVREMDALGARAGAAGVGRGARVAVVMPGGPALAIALLGVMNSGCCCPLDPALPVERLVRTMARMRVDAVVTDDPAGPAGIAARSIGVALLVAGAAAVDESSTGPRAGPAADDAALILHTSGTSGEPKRVILSHANLVAGAGNVARTLELVSADRCVSPMPLFHVHGIVAALLASLSAGASVACIGGADAAVTASTIDLGRATWITAVPTVHAALVRHLSAVEQRPRLRFVRSASSPLPPRLAAELAATFQAPVLEAYGMTEAAHQVTSNRLPPHRAPVGTVGKSAGIDVAVVDDGGAALPSGTRGEVVVRGPSVATRFEADGAAGELLVRTRAPDEWMRTGDAGTLDADGFLTLHGRLAHIIDRGAEKIAPREVEDALLEDERVGAAAVFAIPHPTLGHDVAAAIAPHAGETLDVADVRRSLFSRLAAHKVPKRIVVLDRLPTGASGKVDRAALLRALDDATPMSRVAPQGEAEIFIAAAFADILAVDPADAGATDRFFLLGGDSLTGMQLLTRVHDRFGVAFPLRVLFEHDTPSALAQAIALALAAGSTSAPPPIVRRPQRSV